MARLEKVVGHARHTQRERFEDHHLYFPAGRHKFLAVRFEAG
jgi:hypothetical protein